MRRQRAIVFFLMVCAMVWLEGTAGSTATPPLAAAANTQTFASAETAVSALVDALRSGKAEAIESALGPGSAKLVSSGDKYSDAAERQRFLAAYDQRHELVATAPERMILKVGADDWPFPIPLERVDGRWHFDSAAGVQELINRRIGRNEIAAIRTSLAYVDAQKAFFALTGEFAQHLASSPGKHDGLYWPAAEGEPQSPLEPLMAQAREEGYPGDRVAGKPAPY